LSQPADDAVDMFKQGFVCSQAVFAAFCEKCGLEKSFALRIGSGFGAGIARQQEVCGAVTGAVMFLGLKYGKVKGDDIAAHEKAYDRANVFCKKFIEKNKSIKCSELLGCSMAEAKEKKLFSTLCREFINDNAYNFQLVFKEAIARYGLCNKLYLDYGSTYANAQLTLICGSLGTVKLHTPVRDGASKAYVKTFVM